LVPLPLVPLPLVPLLLAPRLLVPLPLVPLPLAPPPYMGIAQGRPVSVPEFRNWPNHRLETINIACRWAIVERHDRVLLTGQ
jgi:hypothetical protein